MKGIKYDGDEVRRILIGDRGEERVELCDGLKRAIKDEMRSIEMEIKNSGDMYTEIISNFNIDHPESSMLYRLVNLVDLIKMYKEKR